MISPAFATMLCFVQTDAALTRRDRRPAARRVRGALVRPRLRRRPALHQRHRDPAGVGRVAAWRSSRRPRTRCASARRSTGRCASSRWTSCATARAPSGSAASSCSGGGEDVVVPRRARGRQLAAGQGRAARRRPELGPDRAGRRRRDPRHRAAAAGHLHRGRAGLRGGRGDPATTWPRWPRRWPATRSSTTVALPGDGAEAEVFFSDLSHEYVTINADYTT